MRKNQRRHLFKKREGVFPKKKSLFVAPTISHRNPSKKKLPTRTNSSGKAAVRHAARYPRHEYSSSSSFSPLFIAIISSTSPPPPLQFPFPPRSHTIRSQFPVFVCESFGEIDEVRQEPEQPDRGDAAGVARQLPLLQGPQEAPQPHLRRRRRGEGEQAASRRWRDGGDGDGGGGGRDDAGAGRVRRPPRRRARQVQLLLPREGGGVRHQAEGKNSNSSVFPFALRVRRCFWLVPTTGRAQELRERKMASAEEVMRVRKEIVDLHGEMVLLENYSALNYTGEPPTLWIFLTEICSSLYNFRSFCTIHARCYRVLYSWNGTSHDINMASFTFFFFSTVVLRTHGNWSCWGLHLCGFCHDAAFFCVIFFVRMCE